MCEYFAHSTANVDKSDWQCLCEHLRNVAGRAEQFAAVFGAGDWGKTAGSLHDAGKATDAFTKRLEGKPVRVDHSTFGARLAWERAGQLGLLLSYVVAGHHGGLPDGGDQESELHYRLKHGRIPEDVELVPEASVNADLSLPFKGSIERAGFSLSFFTRMIFSCLVDADFLDTEAFCSPEKLPLRAMPANIETLRALKARLDWHVDEKCKEAEPTPVNHLRQRVLTQCREKALLPPQIFSLTVPTGGGKTLSSLTFALDHAVQNGLRRVIYAIPFTSIIEQNARIFQDVLGRENVLEHHCNYKESDHPEESDYDQRRGLAIENWEAPVVVTTNVQLFESLFSNRPSRCRKLHNIAGSVIVLDEAQAIPTEYLEPCLMALHELVAHYSCTVVLCTATQPALDDKHSLKMALSGVREIIDDPAELFSKLRRTEVTFLGPLADAELAERLQGERQVLCIVSTKPHARSLFERLEGSEGIFHLSTNMYPLHRRCVLEQIRQRLRAGQPCRVVSTSLVEAGVDLDFPVVYRAMAGLDSIAQAAGRCNREGVMESSGLGKGKVFVFEPEKPPRMPWIKRCIARAGETLRTLPESDPLGLEAMRRYFELLYDVQDLDQKQILTLLNPKLDRELHIPFKEAAQAFRFIEDETIGVIVAIEPEARKLVQELRYTEYPRSTLRKLQQYSVGLRAGELAAMRGALEMIHGEYPVLCNEAAYSEEVGLCADRGDMWEDGLII